MMNDGVHEENSEIDDDCTSGSDDDDGSSSRNGDDEDDNNNKHVSDDGINEEQEEDFGTNDEEGEEDNDEDEVEHKSGEVLICYIYMLLSLNIFIKYDIFMFTDGTNGNDQYRITLPLFGGGSMIEPNERLAYGNFHKIDEKNSQLLAFGTIFQFVADEGTDPYIIEDCSVPKCGKKSDPSYKDQKKL